MTSNASAFHRFEGVVGSTVGRLIGLIAAAKPMSLDAFRGECGAIRRILLVRPNERMGNVLLATPAISLFRAAYPDAAIDFLAGRGPAPLLAHLPVDDVIPFDRSIAKRPWRFVALVRELRRRHYDLVVDCGFGSKIDGFLAALAGARIRIGADDPRFGALYHVRVPIPDRE